MKICSVGAELFHAKGWKDGHDEANSQLNRGSFESKHNYLMLFSLFKLTTCFGPCTGPSSGHKIYN